MVVESFPLLQKGASKWPPCCERSEMVTVCRSFDKKKWVQQMKDKINQWASGYFDGLTSPRDIGLKLERKNKNKLKTIICCGKDDRVVIFCCSRGGRVGWLYSHSHLLLQGLVGDPTKYIGWRHPLFLDFILFF